jgi:hypothetical protein
VLFARSLTCLEAMMIDINENAFCAYHVLPSEVVMFSGHLMVVCHKLQIASTTFPAFISRQSYRQAVNCVIAVM